MCIGCAKYCAIFHTFFFFIWKLIEIYSYIIEKSNEVRSSTSEIRECARLYGPNSEYMFPCKDSLLLESFVRMLEQVMFSWLVELYESCVPCHVPCRGTFCGRYIKELDLKRIYVTSERRVQMSKRNTHSEEGVLLPILTLPFQKWKDTSRQRDPTVK